MLWMSRWIPTSKQWWSRWGKSLGVLLLVGLLWIGSIASATAGTVEEGKALFEKSCASCHSMDGSGASYGPDLQTVTQRRDRTWLVDWIANPQAVIDSGDAIAQEILKKYNGVPMPNMGLEPAQVESVVVYLEAAARDQSAVAPVSGSQDMASVPEELTTPNPPNTDSNSMGNAAIGQKLFAGTIPFAKGGPACMSCHTVNTVGALRGGTLGPNLTHVIDRYTEVGLKGVLPTLPYPTMQGIYQNKLLTEEEQAHLLEFFKAANSAETESQTPTAETASASEPESFHLSATWAFVFLGIGGFFLCALLSQITWRDRLTGVRQRLVEEHKS